MATVIISQGRITAAFPFRKEAVQRFRVLELQERTNERVIRLIVTKARAGELPREARAPRPR